MVDKAGTSAQGGERQNFDRDQDGSGSGSGSASQSLDVFSTRDPHTNFFVLVAIMVGLLRWYFLPSSSEECAVCLQPLEHPLVLIPCGHDGLCSHCVLQMWLHQGLPCDGVRCPLCRAKATRLRLKAPKVEDKLRARLSRVALWLYNSYTAVGWRASGVIGRLLNDKIAAGAALASVLWFLYRNMGIVRVVFVTAHRVNLVCMFLYFMYKRVTGGRAADWPPVPIVLRF
ncbi:RING-type domain-containing protein [Chloropicon primus]|nr:RING-type domain-containing protein [Chloropicon primus]